MLTGCREYRLGLIELARGTASPEQQRVLLAHAEGCPDCDRVLESQQALSAAFDSMARVPLPDLANIEARVLAEFDRVSRRRRASRWVFAAGIAAAALVGLVAVERRAPVARHAAQVAAKAGQAPVSMAASVPGRTVASVARVRHMVAQVRHMVARVRQVTEESQPFVPIPYTVPLGPDERATVVRMEVPIAALIAAGYWVATSDPGAMVDAEVLVSQDGRARAIRLNSNQEEKQ